VLPKEEPIVRKVHPRTPVPYLQHRALGHIERRYAMARAYLDSPPIRLVDAA
jgi:hypothetical protein